jgi:hypothetical protein
VNKPTVDQLGIMTHGNTNFSDFSFGKIRDFLAFPRLFGHRVTFGRKKSSGDQGANEVKVSKQLLKLSNQNEYQTT